MTTHNTSKADSRASANAKNCAELERTAAALGRELVQLRHLATSSDISESATSLRARKQPEGSDGVIWQAFLITVDTLAHFNRRSSGNPNADERALTIQRDELLTKLRQCGDMLQGVSDDLVDYHSAFNRYCCKSEIPADPDDLDEWVELFEEAKLINTLLLVRVDADAHLASTFDTRWWWRMRIRWIDTLRKESDYTWEELSALFPDQPDAGSKHAGDLLMRHVRDAKNADAKKQQVEQLKKQLRNVIAQQRKDETNYDQASRILSETKRMVTAYQSELERQGRLTTVALVQLARGRNPRKSPELANDPLPDIPEKFLESIREVRRLSDELRRQSVEGMLAGPAFQQGGVLPKCQLEPLKKSIAQYWKAEIATVVRENLKPVLLSAEQAHKLAQNFLDEVVNRRLLLESDIARLQAPLKPKKTKKIGKSGHRAKVRPKRSRSAVA